MHWHIQVLMMMASITTFTVPSNGSSITEVATIEHNTSDASFNSLIQVDSDTYVLAYSGTSEDGFIATFTISSNGATITEVDEIEHDTGEGKIYWLIQLFKLIQIHMLLHMQD